MDYQSRSHKLKAMRKNIDLVLAQNSKSSATGDALRLTQQLPDKIPIPEAQLFERLSSYSQDLNGSLSEVEKAATATLSGINSIKIKKDNVEKLIDVSTCILEIKRLSNGLGETHDEIYRNIKAFYEVRNKAVFCKKYISKIQEEVDSIMRRYRQQFDQELKASHSEHLHQYSRILALAPETSGADAPSSTLQKLLSLYADTLKKEYLTIEDELLNILVVAQSLDKDYGFIFFELVNKCLRLFVNNLKVFRSNTQKLYGDEGVHQLIVHLLQNTLNPLLCEILKRQKKYFELDKIPVNSAKTPILKDKDVLRIQHFCSEYRSISNQVQRFTLYLRENGPSKNYANLTKYAHEIIQTITSETLIEMNDTFIKFSQAFLRNKLNNLIKKSPFITSLWHLDPEFLKSLGTGSLVDVPSMHEFIDELFIIFEKGIKETFETFNMLVISTVINYLANHLIHEDGFYVFNEIFRKYCPKLSATPGPQQAAVILVLNSLHAMQPNFKNLVEAIAIPPELDKNKINVHMQELQIANSNKARHLINNYVKQICKQPYIRVQLEAPNGYKDLLNGWNRLHKELMELFVDTLSETHSQTIKDSIFGKKYDSLSALALEKEIRTIAGYYESTTGAHVMDKFKVLLLYCSVLLLDSQKDLQRLLADLPEALSQEHSKMREVFLLRRRGN